MKALVKNEDITKQTKVFKSKIDSSQIVLIGLTHGEKYYDHMDFKDIKKSINALQKSSQPAKVLVEAINDEDHSDYTINYVVSGRKEYQRDMLQALIKVFFGHIYSKKDDRHTKVVEFYAIDIRDDQPFLSGVGDILFWLQEKQSRPKDCVAVLKSLFEEIHKPSEAVSLIIELVLKHLGENKSASSALKAFKHVREDDIMKALKKYGLTLAECLDATYRKSYILIRAKFLSSGIDALDSNEWNVLHNVLRLLHNYAFDLVAQIFTLSAIVSGESVMMISGLSHAKNLHEFVQSVDAR